MTASARTYDSVRFHRGSRGFAAFVTGLNAAVLLGLALFVTPTLGLEQPAASWFVILAGGAGIAHVVAIIGLIRGRAWSGALVGYLAAEMDAGRMRRHDPRLLLLAAYSMVTGLATELEVLRAFGEEPTLTSLVRRRNELLDLLRAALEPDIRGA